MNRSKALSALILLATSSVYLGAEQPDASNRFYQAVRNNDLASLQSLIKSADVNSKDERGSTPLMFAAAFGSVDGMKLLLDGGAEVNAKNAFDVTALHWCAGDLAKVRLLLAKGADINARSKQGRTPLIVAAAYDGNLEVVKLLIEKGADMAAKDGSGTTPLLAATDVNDTETVKFLVARGADVKARMEAPGARGAMGSTPLLYAASNDNAELVKLLLAKGADVNAVSTPEGLRVKNGMIALGSFTPLLLATPFGRPETVKLLLDAGAKVNVQDVRGMTPLMLAVASDHSSPEVIRLLMKAGADPNIKSKDGESTKDWAKKHGNPQILEILGMKADAAKARILEPAADSKALSPREAAARSIALLQKTTGSFFVEGGCVACHSQNLTGMAVVVARANNIAVNENAAAEQLKAVKLQWAAFDQVMLQRMDPPGAIDTLGYSIMHLAAEKVPYDRITDAIVHNIAAEQHKGGSWTIGGIARPPMEDGDFTRTALGIRALSSYGSPGRKAEYAERIERAAAWLKSAEPKTTEDRNMQLLGLKWANVDLSSLANKVKQLIALQRQDGGWSQIPWLASDAYATGVTLTTLHEMGVPAADAAYQRGVAFLVRTQLEDGSWHVASRAAKFQPYFQSGFPHDHDQWISTSATAWASMALCYASAEKPMTAAIR